MADVYEAYAKSDRGFERRVALKQLRSTSPGNTAFLNGFIDEARIASQMHHSNVVAVLDFGVADGHAYQALEYVDGLDLEDLRAVLEATGRPLPADIALTIATEVAHGLAYAHAARDPKGRPLQVVHRDVSPPNVLISWAGEVKLSDFGIALAVSRLERTELGIAKGKLGYMAPEQILGTAVDGRADVFALGCVIHWMLCGESALDDSNVRDEVLDGRDAPLSAALPPDVSQIVGRATRFRPDTRFADAADMAAASGAALAQRLDRHPRTNLREFLATIDRTRLVALRDESTQGDQAEADRPSTISLEAPASPKRRRPSTPTERPQPVAQLLGSVQIDVAQARESKLPQPSPASPAAIRGPAELFFPDIEQSPIGEVRPSTHVWVPQVQDTSLTAVTDVGDLAVDATVIESDERIELIGTVLHGYRVEERLKRARHARVYRARHLVLEQDYAVEVLDGLGGDPPSQSILHRETQSLSRLQHPNIVSVVDFGATPHGLPFLTSPLVAAPSLDELLAEGPLARSRLFVIARQIAVALEFAHHRGVLHLGLTPMNILVLTDAGRDIVKLVDFGFSRFRALDIETLCYAAPEVHRDPDSVGPGADLFALGAVLYMMLTRRPPFAHPDEIGRAALPLDTQTGLEPLVVRLLALHPNQRFASADHVITAIDSQRRHDPTERLGTTIAMPKQSSPQDALQRRYWMAAIVMMSAAALIGIVLATALWA